MTEDTLRPKQRLLIAALLKSSSTIEACREIKISDDTARRWMKEPNFQQAYNAAQQEAFSEKLDAVKHRENDKLAEFKKGNLEDRLKNLQDLLDLTYEIAQELIYDVRHYKALADVLEIENMSMRQELNQLGKTKKEKVG